MEEQRNRPLQLEDGSCRGDTASKRPRSDEEEEEEDVWAVFVSSTDETMSDLFSELLETSDTTGGAFRVRFVDDPYAATVVYQRSSSYVTINGNDESCGSSFSDSDASAMASVDARGVQPKEAGGAWDSLATDTVAGGVWEYWEDDEGLLASWLGQDCDF